MTDITKFEAQPRWPGAPPICLHANLLAFDNEKAVKAYLETNCPGFSLVEITTCAECGKLHFVADPSGPSGASSGNQRLCWRKKKLALVELETYEGLRFNR